MVRRLVFLIVTITAFAAPATAHPGPHHDIERLTKLLATEPDRVDWLMNRATAYRYDGRFSKALEDLDRAEKLGGDASWIALERGLLLSSLRRDEQAKSELTKHLAGPSPKAIAYVERAAVHERAGRKRAAVDDLTAAIALVSQVDWYLVRGKLQESIGKLDDAASGYRDGLARCSGAVAIRLELIRVERARKRFDVAMELINEALPQADIATDWYLLRADVQEAAGQPHRASQDRARALAEADRAVARRPTAQRLLTRAKVLIAMNQRDKATADLRAALRKTPTSSEAVKLLKHVKQEASAKGTVAHATK